MSRVNGRGFRQTWFNSTRWRPSVYASKRATLKRTRGVIKSLGISVALLLFSIWWVLTIYIYTHILWQCLVTCSIAPWKPTYIFWHINSVPGIRFTPISCFMVSVCHSILHFGNAPHTPWAFNHQGVICTYIRWRLQTPSRPCIFPRLPLFGYFSTLSTDVLPICKTSLHFTDS